MRIAQDRRSCHRRNTNVNIITRSDARRRATYKSVMLLYKFPKLCDKPLRG
nr:MAG TPA: hypothetical protein [Caudoviricetes sp.]